MYNYTIVQYYMQETRHSWADGSVREGEPVYSYTNMNTVSMYTAGSYIYIYIHTCMYIHSQRTLLPPRQSKTTLPDRVSGSTNRRIPM